MKKLDQIQFYFTVFQQSSFQLNPNFNFAWFCAIEKWASIFPAQIQNKPRLENLCLLKWDKNVDYFSV